MFSFDSRIRYSETGQDARLTIPGLLNYFQDASTMHSEDAGVGTAYLRARNLAWVLNFWQVDIDRLPELGEEIVTGTFPHTVKGALGWRNYLMRTKDGEQLAVANALYTHLNLEKHIPVRLDANMIAGYPLEEKLPMDYQPRKILFTGEPAARESITVVRHHIDSNGHVNNAQYVDMAFDLLPRHFSIARILASYHISAVRGDVIYPFVYEGEDTFGIDLRREDGDSFCKVLFQNRKAIAGTA